LATTGPLAPQQSHDLKSAQRFDQTDEDSGCPENHRDPSAERAFDLDRCKVALSSLNDGSGVQAGKIRVQTARIRRIAEVDLTTLPAAKSTDVLVRAPADQLGPGPAWTTTKATTRQRQNTPDRSTGSTSTRTSKWKQLTAIGPDNKRRDPVRIVEGIDAIEHLSLDRSMGKTIDLPRGKPPRSAEPHSEQLGGRYRGARALGTTSTNFVRYANCFRNWKHLPASHCRRARVRISARVVDANQPPKRHGTESARINDDRHAIIPTAIVSFTPPASVFVHGVSAPTTTPRESRRRMHGQQTSIGRCRFWNPATRSQTSE